MLTCANCSAGFTDKNAYLRHKKRCLKEVETFFFKPSNQTIVVKKNNEGKFECHCSDIRCQDKKRAYGTLETLKRHLNTVGSVWVSNIPIHMCYYIHDINNRLDRQVQIHLNRLMRY